jgi:hypothetical protein
VRGWPKNPGQVGPTEGRGNGCTRSLSPSFIGQVHILGILEKIPVYLHVHLVDHETRCVEVRCSH